MTKTSITLFLLACLALGCSQTPQPPAIQEYQPMKDEEVAKALEEHGFPLPGTARLIRSRDSLAQFFELKKQNLPVPSYYHRRWGGRYYMAGGLLMAGLDDEGNLFLIHSYNCTPSLPFENGNPEPIKKFQCADGPALLNLALGDLKFSLSSSTYTDSLLWGSRDAIQRDLVIGTGQFCTDFYHVAAFSSLPQLLASEDYPDLRYSFHCEEKSLGSPSKVGKADRKAIAECASLSRILHALHDGI